jgi:hypothetical protein
MGHDVFISHSHKDKKIADAICHHFEAEKIKCWIAPRDITPGANWAHSIASAIPECKIFLLIFSAHSNISDQVLREVELAVKNKLTVIPVKIEDISPSGGMEYYLSTVHWIDVVNKKTEKYIASLAQTVKGYLDNAAFHTPPINHGDINKKKRKSLALWISVASAAVAIVVLGFIFRDSLFKSNSESLDLSQTTSQVTAEPTNEPTTEPTQQLTSESSALPTTTPTAIPTATVAVDPNIALDTVVDIPDIALKTCILRTLNELGHPVENNVITVSDMRNLTSLTITKELDFAYSFFGASEFISHDHLIAIQMNSKINSLEGLQYASNLEHLCINGMGITDISVLSQINNLRFLDLGSNKIDDISSISHMSKLEGLILRDNNISDIQSLLLLFNINTLDLSINYITDLTPLSDMVQLEALSIRQMNIRNFDGLEKLTKLWQILAGDNPLEDISGISNLKNLYFLEVSNTPLSEIAVVGSLDGLHKIIIKGTNVTDISILKEIEYISQVDIEQEKQDSNQEVVDYLTSRGCVFTDEGL